MSRPNAIVVARVWRGLVMLGVLLGLASGAGCASPQSVTPSPGAAGTVGGGGGAGGESGGSGAGAGGETGAGGSCAGGLSACNGACVDVTSDPSHCGDCGHACGASEGCVASGCQGLPADCRQTPCPGGFYCDLGSGMCRSGCAVDTDCSAGSNRTCNRGSHQCECTGVFHTCGGACLSNGSVGSCGASCSPCPTDPQGTATCNGTSCAIACNGGTLLCGGTCVACADPHGTATCSGTSCALTCQSGYNLCAGRCAAASDPTACGASCSVCAASGTNQSPTCLQGRCSAQCAAGTSICKGQCAAGTCTWTPHVSAAAVSYFAVDVDGSGVIHAATTNTARNPSYLRVAGAGAPVAEVVDTTMPCWDNSSGSSAATRPVVMADGSGKARILCVKAGVTLEQFTWNGTAWAAREAWYGSGGSSGIYRLTSATPRLAFAFTNVGTTTTYTIYFGELPASTTWTWKTITDQGPSILNILGGPPGAAKLGFVGSPIANLQIATETATGFGTARQSIPTVADRYALDGAGNPVGVKGLTFYSYVNGAWVSEIIANGTPTAVDFIVDAAGVPRVAWIDATSVHLATRLGTTWVSEVVASGMSFATNDIDLAVGPTGKVAIGAKTSTSGFTIFE